jgi:small subunit ribosomal protein S8
MSNNDVISSAFSKIMNAETIGRNEVAIYPCSNLLKNMLTIMNEEGYIGTFEETKDTKGSRLKLFLLGRINKCGTIKPRFVVQMVDYERYEKRYLPAKGFGVLIVSTSNGIMTQEKAKEKKIGGKLLAYCY